jgi:hypothetical protein
LEREAIQRNRSALEARNAVRAAQQILSRSISGRKHRDERLSIFDLRRNDRKTVENYARQLAALLEIEPKRKWLNLVCEPWFFHSHHLEQIMLDVKACAAGQEEFLSSAHSLLYDFIEWLDAGIHKAKAQELQMRQVAEFVDIEEASPLLALDVPNAAELLKELGKEMPKEKERKPWTTPTQKSVHPLIAKARAMLVKS